VHIDFNVCFDKGRRLRVPECVPFRLTPNVAGALGALGPGAEFTQRCVQVMSALRDHKVLSATCGANWFLCTVALLFIMSLVVYSYNDMSESLKRVYSTL
jgi:hypothetical protein